MRRWIRHAWSQLRGVSRSFTPGVCAAIEREVSAVESTHQGEICFVVESALAPELLWRRVTPRQRALQCFAAERVWDTEGNNGVLIYVLLADRSVEFVADRGIATKVGDEQWRSLCASVEAHYRRGEFDAGSRQAIRGVAEHLARHFPNSPAGRNELPNQPILL